jgi:hypothetical protein
MALSLVQTASRKYRELTNAPEDTRAGQLPKIQKKCMLTSISKLQMPSLQRRSLSFRHVGQNAQKTHTRSHTHHDANRALPPRRLPTRRRSPRPFLLDAPTLDNGRVPHEPVPTTPIGNQILPHHLRQTIPMLGVRRRLPEMDAEEHAESEFEKRVWRVDVRGA